MVARLALAACLLASAQAYTAQREDGVALDPSEPPQQHDASHDLNIRFQRAASGFHAGVPVPSGWTPLMNTAVTFQRRTSVAKLTEQQAAPEATISYIDSPDLTFSSFVRFGRSGSAGGSAALSLGRRQSPGSVEPALPGKRSWDKGEGKTKAEEKEHYEDELESWMANSRGAAEKRALDYVKNRAYKEAAAKEAEETAKKQGTWNYTKEREEANTWPKRTGISRCGFTWDDAAAKMGEWCSSTPGASPCEAPPGISDNKDSYWFNHSYDCYTDLPDIGVRVGGRVCHAISKAASDTWCMETCNSGGVTCDKVYCSCSDDGTGLEDMDAFKTEETLDISAPIQPHVANIRTWQLPNITEKLVEAVIQAGTKQPGGLPDCTWRPGSSLRGFAPTCTNESQYECVQGPSQGRCSHFNWFDKPEECAASCVHTSLLKPAPYYALWYPGPLAKEFKTAEKQPRYKHTASRFSLRVRGIETSKSDVMMSGICKSQSNHFVGAPSPLLLTPSPSP